MGKSQGLDPEKGHLMANTFELEQVMRGQLRAGMRVLVHSGTGAVGLAAIQICLSRGAEVMSV